MTEAKPLSPLTYGSILIVGCKPTNFGQDIRENPRVIMWESQNQKWEGNNLPQNVRAVFITRWIGHKDFDNIMREAKKKRITIFNPLGTGMIAKQVRELLNVNHTNHTEPVTEPVKELLMNPVDSVNTNEPVKEPRPNSKLHQLLPFVDWSKSNSANGKILMEKAKELGFKSTPASIANYIGNIRREKGLVSITKPGLKPKKSIQVKPKYQGDDAVVEILDNIIKELTDIRQYFVAVTDENETLKARIAKFKKFLDE